MQVQGKRDPRAAVGKENGGEAQAGDARRVQLGNPVHACTGLPGLMKLVVGGVGPRGE